MSTVDVDVKNVDRRRRHRRRRPAAIFIGRLICKVDCKIVKNCPILMILDIFPMFLGSGNPFLESKYKNVFTGNIMDNMRVTLVTIQLPDMSSIQMFKSSLIAEWSAIQMGSE